MSCEYCGRTNHDDGHGGCYACGAPVTPVKQTRYEVARDSESYYATMCSSVYISQYTPISRKRVTIG